MNDIVCDAELPDILLEDHPQTRYAIKPSPEWFVYLHREFPA